MKKIFIVNILLFLALSISSCGPMDLGTGNSFEANIGEIMRDNTYGVKGGIKNHLSIEELTDSEENPVMNTWDSIEFYPLREVSEDVFEYFYFYIYCEANCEAYVNFSIIDEVIEYETVQEKVEDPETGEITIVEKQIEVNRYTEVINLSEDGKLVELSNSKGVTFFYIMNYVIKSYSSSTCFKLILTDENGEVLPYKWGVDEVQIITSKIDNLNE